MSILGETSMLKRILITVVVVIAGIMIARFLLIKGKAPETQYRLLNGNVVSTSDFKGQVLVINFWATSCSPCIKEMPDLAKTYERYRPRGFDMIAVAVSSDDLSKVLAYTDKKSLPFKVAFDSTGSATQAWGGIRAIPTTFVLDRNGRIAHRFVGTVNPVEFNRTIEKLL